MGTMLQRAGELGRRLAQQTSLTSLKQWGLEQGPVAGLAEKMPSWIMLGPPGVGKGTYSSRVAKLLGISHISAGDLVRDEIKNQTECGQQVRPRARHPWGAAGATAVTLVGKLLAAIGISVSWHAAPRQQQLQRAGRVRGARRGPELSDAKLSRWGALCASV